MYNLSFVKGSASFTGKISWDKIIGIAPRYSILMVGPQTLTFICYVHGLSESGIFRQFAKKNHSSQQKKTTITSAKVDCPRREMYCGVG